MGSPPPPWVPPAGLNPCCTAACTPYEGVPRGCPCPLVPRGTQVVPIHPPWGHPMLKGVLWESPPYRAQLPLPTTCTPHEEVPMGSLLPQPPPQGSPPPARSLYPPITSDGARQRYKQEFDTDLKRYKQLCAEMDSINDRLNQLSRRLDSITEDSPQYQVCPGGGSREGCGAAAGQWGSTASGMLWGTGDAAWVWGCCKAVWLLWGSGAAVGVWGCCRAFRALQLWG